MMAGARRALLAAAALLAFGTAAASGSFSVRIDPLELTLEANVEQEVARTGGLLIYAGSGFAVDPGGVRKLQPYILVCHELGLPGVAYSEVCAEARAPLLGTGRIISIYLSVVY